MRNVLGRDVWLGPCEIDVSRDNRRPLDFSPPHFSILRVWGIFRGIFEEFHAEEDALTLSTWHYGIPLCGGLVCTMIM